MIERIGKLKLLWILISIIIATFCYKLDKVYNIEIKNGYDVKAKVVFKKCSYRRTSSIFVQYKSKDYEVILKQNTCRQLEINDQVDLKYIIRKDRLFVHNHNPYQKYFRMSIAFLIASLFPFKTVRKIIYKYQ